MSRCLHIKVKGRVQGVAFRAYTQKLAIELNLLGYVRNLADGDVEVLAHGHTEALEQLLAWCHQGPSLAKVTEVIVNQQDSYGEFHSFEIR